MFDGVHSDSISNSAFVASAIQEQRNNSKLTNKGLDTTLDMPTLASYLKEKLKEKGAEIAALKLELKHVRQKLPINHDKLNELLLAGYSMGNAAKEVGCSKSAAHRAHLKLIESGLIKKKESLKVQIINLRQSGLTYKQICREIDSTETWVREICSQAGLTNRCIKKP